MKRNINKENNQNNQLNRNYDEGVGKVPIFGSTLFQSQNSNQDFLESKQRDDDNNLNRHKELNPYLNVVYQFRFQDQYQDQEGFQLRSSRGKENRPSCKLSSPAERERMKLLKIACTNEMVKHISVENAALILHLCRCGHRFEPYNLKVIALFCFDNYMEIIKSRAFVDHFGDDPEEFKTLYTKILEDDKTQDMCEEFNRLLI